MRRAYRHSTIALILALGQFLLAGPMYAFHRHRPAQPQRTCYRGDRLARDTARQLAHECPLCRLAALVRSEPERGDPLPVPTAVTGGAPIPAVLISPARVVRPILSRAPPLS